MPIFHHVTSVFYEKMFAIVFLCFIAGECHGSVNIDAYCICTVFRNSELHFVHVTVKLYVFQYRKELRGAINPLRNITMITSI